MNKPKYHPDSGFSLLEVLMAVVVVTFFTAAAMQLVVISTAFKAKAKEYTTATNLIQKDLEGIRAKASQFEFPEVSAAIDPANPVRTIQLDSFESEDFSNGQDVQFQGAGTTYRISSVDPITNEITLAADVADSISAGSALVNNTLCNGAVDSGLGKTLKDKIATDLTTIPTELAGNFTVAQAAKFSNYRAVRAYSPSMIPNTELKLWMIREDIVPDRRPYDVLEVKYVVIRNPNKDKDQDGKLDIEILAEFSTEVIPNAAFQCFKL
jgi:prepilin-type N-terminal cleavage/methylation domain-containing protein